MVGMMIHDWPIYQVCTPVDKLFIPDRTSVYLFFFIILHQSHSPHVFLYFSLSLINGIIGNNSKTEDS